MPASIIECRSRTRLQDDVGSISFLADARIDTATTQVDDVESLKERCLKRGAVPYRLQRAYLSSSITTPTGTQATALIKQDAFSSRRPEVECHDADRIQLQTGYDEQTVASEADRPIRQDKSIALLNAVWLDIQRLRGRAEVQFFSLRRCQLDDTTVEAFPVDSVLAPDALVETQRDATDEMLGRTHIQVHQLAGRQIGDEIGFAVHAQAA